MELYVKVNGEIISKKNINKKFVLYLDEIRNAEQIDVFAPEQMKSFKVDVANEMIDNLLLTQFGRKHLLIPSSDEVTQQLGSIKEKLKIEKQDENYDDNELRSHLTQEIVEERIGDFVLQKTLANHEIDVKAYYEQNKNSFSLGEAVEVRHILLQIAQNKLLSNFAQAQGEEILKRLNSGEEFAELAKLFSTCPSSERGGELGFITHGEIDELFEKKAFSLKENEMSDIFETDYGLHIIQVLKRVENYIPPLEQMEKQLKECLQTALKNEALENLLYQLRNEADIEYIGLA